MLILDLSALYFILSKETMNDLLSFYLLCAMDGICPVGLHSSFFQAEKHYSVLHSSCKCSPVPLIIIVLLQELEKVLRSRAAPNISLQASQKGLVLQSNIAFETVHGTSNHVSTSW